MIDDYELSVDGSPGSLHETMFHQQEQPFPGGLTYRLTIRNRDGIEQLRKRFGEGIQRHLSAVDESFVLGYVNLLVSLELRTTRYAHGIKHWINNIQQLDVQQDQVVLTGECSHHISPGR